MMCVNVRITIPVLQNGCMARMAEEESIPALTNSI